jgi:hypothetical protein
LLGAALYDSAFHLVAEKPPPEVPFAGASNDDLSPRERRAGHLKTLSFITQILANHNNPLVKLIKSFKDILEVDAVGICSSVPREPSDFKILYDEYSTSASPPVVYFEICKGTPHVDSPVEVWLWKDSSLMTIGRQHASIAEFVLLP